VTPLEAIDQHCRQLRLATVAYIVPEALTCWKRKLANDNSGALNAICDKLTYHPVKRWHSSTSNASLCVYAARYRVWCKGSSLTRATIF
jgi:hypothetical protein